MNNKLEQLLAGFFFVLWLRGECPAEEQKQWYQWLLEDPEHRLLVLQAKQIVVAIDRYRITLSGNSTPAFSSTVEKRLNTNS